ncbi:MAG: hypothetical protein ACLUFI_05195 [Oscillospiraceae bacterium]
MPQANQVLLALCDSVAARLRADGRRCLCLTVTIRGSDFKNRSHQRRLPEPSDVTQELYDCAKSLFAEFWDGRPLRLLGVTLSDLTDGQTQQLSLFPDEKRDRARKARPGRRPAPRQIRPRRHLPAAPSPPPPTASTANSPPSRQIPEKSRGSHSGSRGMFHASFSISRIFL